MNIQFIHTRKQQIKLEQSALLGKYGKGKPLEQFAKMAESKTDDCIKFIAYCRQMIICFRGFFK